MRQIEAHIFQFTVWRFSPKARMLQEFIVTLLFTAVLDTLIAAFLNQIPPLKEFELQLFEMEGKLGEISDPQSVEYARLQAKIRAFQYYFEPLRLQFYEDMMFMTYVFFATLFFVALSSSASVTSSGVLLFNAAVLQRIHHLLWRVTL